MRPLLAFHDDGRPHARADIREAVAEEFRLTPEERAETIASGPTRFTNRVTWATTYLAQAGALERPSRGVTRITDRGRTLLAEHPNRIDRSVLAQFEEYQDFRARSRRRRIGEPAPPVEGGDDATPEELIENAHRELRAALADDILLRVLERDDRFFEELVLKLLVALGYGGRIEGAAERLGQAGDGGVDGVIREDRLGIDVIYVQAKRWARDRQVGPKHIREFIGALHDIEANKGVFITTSTFSSEARNLAQRRRVVLIDGTELAEHMIDVNVGVATTETYALKKIDVDFFDDTNDP
jgi:restriction system protein